MRPPLGRLLLGDKARTLGILPELRGPWRISRPLIVRGPEQAVDRGGASHTAALDDPTAT
jgi:hypothetical protein